MKILVTGTAGFIGFHLALSLIKRGDEVVGFDNINDYYDLSLKYARLKKSGINEEEIEYNKLILSHIYPNYKFIQLNLEDRDNLQKLFCEEKFDVVSHMAAQAGVRYSIYNPYAYIDSNIVGFINILECCRNFDVKSLSFASSSSVYGLNEKEPFSTHDNIDHPISLYAATKKSNELMAHTYSYLYNIPITGLRFFTVYGPWGRPDMAPIIFTKAISENKAMDVYNYGNMRRDFTYIDDIINGVVKVIDSPANCDEKWSGLNPSPNSSKAPYKIYNIGNSCPIKLMDFIEEIEKNLGKKAIKNFLPLQKGDVVNTYANVEDLITNFNYKPTTNLKEGVFKFINWYKSFYG